MATEVKVDGSGRMVIPARLRRSLGLGGHGGTVVLSEGTDGVLLHAPANDRDPPTVDDHGLLVLDPGRSVGVDEVAAATSADRNARG